MPESRPAQRRTEKTGRHDTSSPPTKAAHLHSPFLRAPMAAIDTFYPTMFQTSFDQALQQMDSRLLSAITRADFTGKKKWFNLLNDSEAQDILTRKGDTPDGELDASKYWLTQRPKEKVTTFDEWDKHFLGTIVLPTSDEVQSHAMAFNRAIDDVIIASMYATRYIGEDGTTTDAFPAGQSIGSTYVETGSATASGLTVAKLRRAKNLMDLAEVPKSDRYIVIGAQQEQDLLRDTAITSADFNTVKALVDGNVGTFLGFTFLNSQRLPVGTVDSVADIRSCFAFHKSAIKFAMSDRQTRMDVLPMRRHALQIRSTMMLGAVRTENEKVVRIYSDETP